MTVSASPTYDAPLQDPVLGVVNPSNALPFDPRGIPAGVALATIIVQFIATLRHRRKQAAVHDIQGTSESTESLSRFQKLVKRQGSKSILGFNILRFLACAGLMVLSAYTSCYGGVKIDVGFPWDGVLRTNPETYLILAFLYSTILAAGVFIADEHLNLLIRSNIVVTFSALAVYAYRDLWPLATYHLHPVDAAEGPVLWVKIALLVLVAVVIPLFIPTRYVPNPAPRGHPEQTAPIISSFTWSYLEPIIWLGYRVPHLSHTQLPDAPDYDETPYLRETKFPFLDPLQRNNTQRHLFWGLMHTFRREFLILTCSIITEAFVSLISPACLNRLLAHLENPKNATIKPWFWIIGLFVGTMAFSIAQQTYLHYFTAIHIRTEALLTQLVFEHALRIRLKAETGSEDDDERGGAGIRPESGTSTPKRVGGESVSEMASLLESETGASDSLTANASRQPSDSTNVEGLGTVKAKEFKSAKKDEEKGRTKKVKSSNLMGRINNLATTDLINVGQGTDFIVLVLLIPLQIGVCMLFLYQILGWSAFIGCGVLVATWPFSVYVTKLVQEVAVQKMKATDARVQTATETIGVVRMIKLFGWENKMAERLQSKRDEELKWLLKLRVFELANGCVNFLIPMISMLATYAFFTAVLKQSLSASIIFSSMAVFNIITEQLHRAANTMTAVVQGKVSLDRFNEFLKSTELLDEFVPLPESHFLLGDDNEEVERQDEAGVDHSASFENVIGFRNAMFAWSAESQDGTLTPQSRSFRLVIEGELFFKEGGINLIIGPTGSGKTSILMALLGEMHFIPTHSNSWFNLPREGGVAYASQESWVQNQTIRENILFGSPYDEQRYRKVLKQCALEKDIELFEAGDLTEVGERGLTLSGGQKARVALARAIYSPAKVILLDDVLAALDVHTAAWVVDKCLRGDLVKGRTIMLVTHNVALTVPIADFIVSLRIDGTVKAQGTKLKEVLLKNSSLAAEIKKDEEATQITQQDIYESENDREADGKLVIAEEIQEGRVSWRSFKLLLKGLAGDHPVLFSGTCIVLLMLADWSNTLFTWFLGYWGSQYDSHHASEVQVPFYLSVVCCLLTFNCVAYCTCYVYYAFRTVRATKSIHLQLMDSVFHGTLRWLDETPVGRIITRFTQDVRSIDGPVCQELLYFTECVIYGLSRLGVVLLFSPIFVVPGFLMTVTGIYIGNVYLKAQLSVKRESSNARAPLLANLNAAIHGLVSIRAYGAQEMFKKESLERLTHYTKVARISWSLNRWIAVRIDLLGATFTTSLAVYLIYFGRTGTTNVGLSLNMALSLSMLLLLVVRLWNTFEVEANSLERIQGYLDIDHEPKATERGQPAAAWPTSGDLRVEGLSARYSKSGPNVLHNLSFHIKAGERVGIVGRTGSGKSSLTLALLRCIPTEGKVYYDGVAADTLNLDALRSNITIIPQTPELLSGTLRENLDPFGQHDDATLNDALQAAGLFSLQEDMEEGHITLDTKISGGGMNLSVGQRQILALARAMVRGSKLLILDEATSAIDYKTDSVIQTTLRQRLGADVTVITIAHRLQTIMDADKIMVLDNGDIVEFDSPRNLLKDTNGRLTALVEESGNKDSLVMMAEGHSLEYS